MKTNKILGLITVMCLSITSCGNKPLKTDTSEDIAELSVSSVSHNYTINKLDTDFDIISGISNGEIYGIDYSTYYSVYYADTESPDGSRSFTSDLAGIFYLKEQNDKKYIYGYNQEDTYKIYTYSSDMTECSEIPFEDGHCTSVAPFQDGRIFVSVLDGLSNYLRIYSPDGEIMNTVYPDLMNEGDDPWVYDSVVINDDKIILAVNRSGNYEILAFDNNLEYIGNIYSDIEYSDNLKFSECNNVVYLCSTNYEQSTADFYSVSSDMSPLEYITSLTSVDYTVSCSGNYDFGYIKNDDLYGFKVSEDSSDKILVNTSPDYLFSCSGALNYVFSDNKHTLQLVKKGSAENELIYELVDSDLFNYERISYPEHFQALKYADRQYSVYDISLKNRDAEIIPLDLDDSYYVNDLLVSKSNIYVYLTDESDCCYIKIFDRSGSEVYEYSSENIITDFSVMNDGGLFIIEEDSISNEYLYSVFNAGEYEPVRLELSEIPEEQCLNACFPSYTDNTVYLMSDDYVYSAQISSNSCEIAALVSLKKIKQSLDNGIYNFICENEDMYIVSGNSVYQLTEADSESRAENISKPKDILNIACINCIPDEWVKEKFETDHPEYSINYILYDTSEEDFTDTFNISLVSDSAPDMIVMKDEGTSDFSITRDNNKGAYTDLYTLISDDEELDRMDFRDSVLTAMEYKGKLFQISPYFTVRTILAKEDIVNEIGKWSVEEFTEFLNNHPNSSFFRNDKDIISSSAFNLMPFYNFITNQCRFDTNEFRNLIEAVQSFPETAEIVQEFSLLDTELYNYNQINEAENVYFKGDKAVNIGFPDIEGNGAVIIPDLQFSVMENSKNKKEAWDVIKYYLSEEYFDRNYAEIQRFPVINSLSDKLEKITESITEDSEYLTLNSYDFMKNQVKLKAPDKHYTEAVDDIINNASVVYRYDFRIESIFLDEYFEYLGGGSKITDMSKNIQKKVEIYLGERD